MDRRNFMQLMPLIATSTLVGCNVEDVSDLEDFHARFITLYETEQFDELVTNYYSTDCTVYSDSSMRKYNKLRNALKAMHRVQKRSGMFPTRVDDLSIRTAEDIAVIRHDIKSKSGNTISGLLTLICEKGGANWKIVHSHFSTRNSCV